MTPPPSGGGAAAGGAGGAAAGGAGSAAAGRGGSCRLMTGPAVLGWAAPGACSAVPRAATVPGNDCGGGGWEGDGSLGRGVRGGAGTGGFEAGGSRVGGGSTRGRSCASSMDTRSKAHDVWSLSTTRMLVVSPLPRQKDGMPEQVQNSPSQRNCGSVMCQGRLSGAFGLRHGYGARRFTLTS
jgi:hypothetical protein